MKSSFDPNEYANRLAINQPISADVYGVASALEQYIPLKENMTMNELAHAIVGKVWM